MSPIGGSCVLSRIEGKWRLQWVGLKIGLPDRAFRVAGVLRKSLTLRD